MGIDVEMYAEVFDGERWRPAEPLVENEDYDPEVDPTEPKLRPQFLYIYRNRALFNMLTEAIAPCRDLPGDVSPEVAAIERPRHDGLFNHSWLGLDELLAFDWKNPIVQMTGMVDPDVAPLFEDNPLGFPYERWPKGKKISYSSWSQDGVSVRWRETREMLAGTDFMEGVLPKLKSFGPAKCVRIVFWFDT
jgi:hypothetical protein